MIILLCSWIHAKPYTLKPVVEAFEEEMHRGLELALEKINQHHIGLKRNIVDIQSLNFNNQWRVALSEQI